MFAYDKTLLHPKFKFQNFALKNKQFAYFTVFPGKSGREISREVWDFEISVSREIYAGISGNFFNISMDFSGTDVCHSDTKNALLQIYTFFCLLKIIFQNSPNFLRRNASEIKLSSLTKLKNSN